MFDDVYTFKLKPVDQAYYRTSVALKQLAVEQQYNNAAI